jgi:hypothetical protein
VRFTAGALRGRGIPEPAASLAAETGIAAYKVAFARWIREPGQASLPAFIQETTEELGSVLTARLTAPALPRNSGAKAGPGTSQRPLQARDAEGPIRANEPGTPWRVHSPVIRQGTRTVTSPRCCQPYDQYRRRTRRSASYAPFWHPTR